MSSSSKMLLLAVALLAAAACKVPPVAKRQSAPKAIEGQTTATISMQPLALFGQRTLPDKFNPEVSDGERMNPRPRRGGSIVVRFAGDCQTLNPLLRTWEQEQTVVSYLTDTLAALDGDTFEIVPKTSQYIKARDLVEKRNGTRLEGLVTTRTATHVTFAPGASVWMLLKSDVVSTDSATGVVKTKFGQELRAAELKPYFYSIVVREAPSTTPITLAIDELSTWTNLVGDREEVRPSIKSSCVYEFRLRDGIQWHDGRPVTMRDAKTWFDTMRNERVDAANLRFLYLDVEKMELLDEMTAKFTYKKPYYKSLEVCGGVEFLPTHILQPDRFQGDPEGYAQFFNKHKMGMPGKDVFVGLGPYKLDHWTPGQEIVLTRNDNYWASDGRLNYWDKGRPYLDKITFRIIVEKTPALREMENGRVDADFDIEPDTWALPMTNTKAFTSRFARARPSVSSYTYVGWNMEREVFKDKRVRQALTMLLPLEAILKEIHYGLGHLAVGPTDDADPWGDPTIKPLPYDPETARRLLREAGWLDRDGDGVRDKNGRRFEFEYLFHTARDYHAKIADVVKMYLGQAGIQVNLRKIDVSILHDQVADHNFDAVRLAWGGVIDPDPYQIWHSSQRKNRGSNYVSYVNPELDRLIEQLREEFDRDKRWALMRKVDRLIYQDQPYTFMYVFDHLAFYNKQFRGVKFYRYSPNYDLTEWYAAEGAR